MNNITCKKNKLQLIHCAFITRQYLILTFTTLTLREIFGLRVFKLWHTNGRRGSWYANASPVIFSKDSRPTLEWRHNGHDGVSNHHSVESPSTLDPQWDTWYWGSKWNLHTVCLSAVGCEWGTTSVYFGITYVCFIPSRLPVFAVEPQYLLQDFLFLSKVSFEGHIENLQKISCWFKIWMGFVGPKLIKLWTSSIWGFL